MTTYVHVSFAKSATDHVRAVKYQDMAQKATEFPSLSVMSFLFSVTKDFEVNMTDDSSLLVPGGGSIFL